MDGEAKETQDIIVNIDMNGVISELQNVQTQNAEIIQIQNDLRTDMNNGFVLVGMFTFVIALLSIRNMVLSWTKRGVRDV